MQLKSKDLHISNRFNNRGLRKTEKGPQDLPAGHQKPSGAPPKDAIVSSTEVLLHSLFTLTQLPKFFLPEFLSRGPFHPPPNLSIYRILWQCLTSRFTWEEDLTAISVFNLPHRQHSFSEKIEKLELIQSFQECNNYSLTASRVYPPCSCMTGNSVQCYP